MACARVGAGALTLLLAGLLPTSARAATDAWLLGDWHGARSRLADGGTTFKLGYTSEVAHNATGGTRQITRYADQWTLGASFDLDKWWGWHGATFQVTVTERSGRDLGADAHIGNNQLIQEIYGRGQTWHLTHFALDQTFLEGALDWRLGRLTPSDDFASFACDFQNLTFCGSQPGNIVGDYWVNWPTSEWATRLRLKTGTQTYLQIGAYQVNPHYVDDHYARRNGWKPDFPGGTTGALIPLEFGWTPSVGGRPGSYKIGLWYNTSAGDDLYLDQAGQPLGLSGGDPLQHASRRGAYINFQQQLSGDDPHHGAVAFLNVSQADRATSATDRQLALGVMFGAPFGRPRDSIGVAFGATHANGRAAARQRQYNTLHPQQRGMVADGYEYVGEVFYGWSPLPSITLRPNVQYIVHPGGAAQNRDALVWGLKSTIAF